MTYRELTVTSGFYTQTLRRLNATEVTLKR